LQEEDSELVELMTLLQFLTTPLERRVEREDEESRTLLI
jgi:hypothetical protein